MQPPATEAGKAQLALAELALAARCGPLGPATVLAYVARLQRHLVHLADYENAADEMAAEALDEFRAREEAIRTGAALAFPARPRLCTGRGGSAA